MIREFAKLTAGAQSAQHADTSSAPPVDPFAVPIPLPEQVPEVPPTLEGPPMPEPPVEALPDLPAPELALEAEPPVEAIVDPTPLDEPTGV